jgi:hypothetical protein
MKQVYPTFILNVNDNSEHPFLVCVPDMDILTEGSSFADAIENFKMGKMSPPIDLSDF